MSAKRRCLVVVVGTLLSGSQRCDAAVARLPPVKRKIVASESTFHCAGRDDED